ncbi:MAG TPA: Crp/Fnr family transcriptional regulator [Allosphingosinicella sp.]|nr:Crp/Fnr family transcriptional regulator [Allosphingosinicella sp.]
MTDRLALRLQAFVRLSAEDRSAVERLVRAAPVRQVQARCDIVREGDRPRAVILLLDGWASRCKTLPDGRRQVVALLVPGDLCDVDVFLLEEMDHYIGALTAVRIAEIGRDEIEGLARDRPGIDRALRRDALLTTSIQREWTLNVGQRGAYERIAHLLAELFFRLRAVGLADGPGFAFPLTQTDIAEATALTPVHVNRTLQELRRDGLIRLDRRTLAIPSLDRLADVAMFNPAYLHLGREDRHLHPNGV